VATRISDPDIEILKGYLPILRSQARCGADGWHDFPEIEVGLGKELIRISKSLLYKAVLTPIHENIFHYAAPCISGEDANVEESLDDIQRRRCGEVGKPNGCCLLNTTIDGTQP
jgi:hypothetical protein